MITENKIFDFLGDSITEGRAVEDIENNRYDNIIKRQCKLKAVYNYGISGTRIAHQHNASVNPRKDLCFCGRAFDLSRDADVIVVFGGTNDYNHGDAEFGEMSDKTPDTFCGGVDFLMNTLLTTYPKAKIIFMTPAHREGDIFPSKNPCKASDAKPLKAYCEIIKEKGQQYGIPVLDLYEKLGLDPNNSYDKENYAPDGLHFNDKGHKLIAEQLIKFINELT